MPDLLPLGGAPAHLLAVRVGRRHGGGGGVAVAAEREGPGAPAVVLAAAPLAGRQVDVDNLTLGTLDQAAVSAVHLRGVTQEALNERIKLKSDLILICLK